MLIQKPIMLIKPKQVKLTGGRVHYDFFQEYLLQSDHNLQNKDFKIRLIFNAVNHYAPFHPKESGDVINSGSKTPKYAKCTKMRSKLLQKYQQKPSSMAPSNRWPYISGQWPKFQKLFDLTWEILQQ